MKNTTWDKIIPGEIVNFVYKSKHESRGTRRWVICIDPKYTYRKKNGRTSHFFVGIQLDQLSGKRVPKSTITKIIHLMGGIARKQSDVSSNVQINIDELSTDKVSSNVSKPEFTKVYSKLKFILGKHNIFRTYNLRECKKRRVFLETKYNYIPKENIENFNLEIDLGREVVIED